MADAEPHSIQSLLKDGYFTTSRSKSPRPASRPLPSLPRRRSPSPDRAVPRYLPRPPPPTCEDEAEALAKEHGSVTSSSLDEPPSRGDVDQFPLIEVVHEHNPERRFVHVSDSSGPLESPIRTKERTVSDTHSSSAPKIVENEDYKANTARKYDPVAPDVDDSTPEARSERRRSRQDLPPLETSFASATSGGAGGHRRSMSTTYVDQPPPDFSYRAKQHLSTNNEDHLSPQVIKHATGGRDKVYYDYSRSQNSPASAQRSRSTLGEGRRVDDPAGRSASSLTPGTARRSAVSAEAPLPTSRLPGDQSGDVGRRSEYGPDSYDRRRERRASMYRRESPPPSSSSAEHLLKAPSSNTRRRRSAAAFEERPVLHNQDGGYPVSSTRPRSWVPVSPIPSSKSSGRAFADGHSPTPRSAATFPMTHGSRGPSLPYPEDDLRPGKDGSGSREGDPRAPSFRSRGPPTLGSSTSMPVAIPAVMPVLPPEPTDEASQPPAPSSTDTRITPMEPDTRQESSWPPPPFEPDKTTLTTTDQSTGSYRRYSEDASRGGTAPIPDCPRRKGVTGKADWLSLPRCDHFDICPDCYMAVFAETPYRNEFVPTLFRPMDRPIRCDFGSSPWYRIAWLLTLKEGYPDLRLFHLITNVAHNQPCPGNREAVRIWYSVVDPYSQTTVPDFTVCYECAKTIEVLLPNLTGIFVPQQTPAVPTWGTCAMYFHPKRRRFVLYFDAMETTSDKALATNSPPNISALARTMERLSLFTECTEDRPVTDKGWHIMQHIPEFTVCGECFDEVVRPRLEDNNPIARNFYMQPQRLPVGTCQLYSSRMRDVFRKACRRNDVDYLEAKVLERQRAWADIRNEMARLDQHGQNDAWTKREVDKLIDEWKSWE
ncbi:hypothetical protein SODALDRAFT_294704 [Sodiomyces alkalinus F11]|uniref:Ser/arg-related nuclear matrix protein n=1 Tax=Sodiomyces alkalinus (strain CBS 110278 / VKM F-3762 / F11) TaxID=1314773 RepID=A0A3N2PXV2_SODAK|nr:hypothetical protein SODALDRAFT_294704 [Sodiomyces alkalinus F11]ROT39312.1 hypothetical protein SODALDRAFT_294704 [Sodiomyces alkalinus F11]